MIKNDVAFVVVGAKSKAELNRCLQGIFDQAVPDACDATVYFANPVNEPNALVERGTSPINVRRIDRRPDDIGDVASDVLLISKEISETHEWIWIINASDQLYSRYSLRDAIKAVDLAAMQFEAITSVHFDDAKHAQGTKSHHIGKLSAFCNQFGFLQIVGRGACLLVRSYVFRTAFGKYFENAVNNAAGSLLKRFWLVGKFLYLASRDENVMFYDAQIVANNNELPLWFAANDKEIVLESEYCFQLAEEFMDLSVAAVGSEKFSLQFFRTKQTLLWQHLIRCQEVLFRQMIDETANIYSSDDFPLFLENWSRINDLAKMVDNGDISEKITSVVTRAASYSAAIMNGSDDDLARLSRLFESERQNDPLFPSTIF